MSAKPPPIAPVSNAWQGLRMFWPYCALLWFLPPLLLLLFLKLGSPILAFVLCLPIGLVSGIPAIRGRMTFGVAQFLYTGLTLVTWCLVYLAAIALAH